MALKYSLDFKQSIIQKILMPGGPTIMEMAVKTGAHQSTIRDWMKIYGNTSSMKKSNEWTPQSKLEAIIKTATMSDQQLGEYLRSNGLHSADIEQWKQDFYSATKSPGRPKIDPEVALLRNKEKELSRDLLRKDRALAEMSARVILLKKSRAIFGEPEDDE